ncbi:MAG: LysM peptidoglycan-binding domain-containing protein [Singulisphaera sp.]
MPNRKKFLVLTIVVVAGLAAAFVFRKTPTPESASSPISESTATRVEPASTTDKPAPVSHLTGAIDPAEKALEPRVAGNSGGNERPGFGLSATTSGGTGFSTLRPPAEASEPPADALAAGGQPPAASGAGFSELRRHRIGDGDTLSGLAVRYLGSADRYREIYDLNREVLSNPDLLPIGTELKIPALGSKVTTPGSINNRPMVPVAPRNSANVNPTAATPGM